MTPTKNEPMAMQFDITGTSVRSRAPLRLGFAGGGTDLSPFCDRYGGAVLNCTIDRYAYAFISSREDGKVVFRGRDVQREECHESDYPLDIRDGLRLHRCAYNHFFQRYPSVLKNGLTLTTTVDAPPGSGLGSSSALVVAICEAFRSYCGDPLGLYDLAHLAFALERIELDLAGGKQDHYSAAFGGVNFIEFLPQDRVIVNPLRIERAVLNELEASLVICFTGISRDSETIIRQQTNRMETDDTDAVAALLELKHAAVEMKQALLAGDMNSMADTLARSWISKQKTASAISSKPIEHIFKTGLECGAISGKISGAGGGGFIMFMVRPEDRRSLIAGLSQVGGLATPVHFTSRGVETWRVPKPR